MINNVDNVTVYVAGPYTSNPSAATSEAIKWGNKLRNLGFYPFIPHLYHFWEQETQRHYEDWFDMDLLWLSKCDCLVRIPGKSSGADREVAFCEANGIPVFYSPEEAAKEMFPQKMGRIFCLLGPSGVGKTTIQNALFENGFVQDIAISTTTRQPRCGESDFVDYEFVTDDEFEDMLFNQEFLEHVEFYGNSYGLKYDEFISATFGGEDVVVVLNRDGLKALREVYGDCVYGILLVPPSIEELQRRVSMRGDKSTDDVSRHSSNTAAVETMVTEDFDLVVVNNDLKEAVKAIGNFIEGHAVRIEVEDE